MRSSRGCEARRAACASSTASSSPSCVLAASHTSRRPPIASRRALSCAASGGAAPRICFRSPTHTADRAPRCLSTSAIGADCASVTWKPRSSSWRVASIGGACDHRRAEVAERRPLSRAVGMRAFAASRSTAGQSSLSMSTRAVGLHTRSSRRTTDGASTGRRRSATRGPRCSSISLRSAASVLVVMSTRAAASLRSRARTTGKAERDSPTDAACTHSTKPSLTKLSLGRESASSACNASTAGRNDSPRPHGKSLSASASSIARGRPARSAPPAARNGAHTSDKAWYKCRSTGGRAAVALLP